MPKYRKRPVIIEAVQYNGNNVVPGTCTGGAGCKSKVAPDGCVPHIHTLEGDFTVSVGDFVIRGVKGEFYSCKPDIFAATYEPTGTVSEADRLFSLLRELAEASKDYASSDPTMLSHDGVEYRFDAALEAAEEVLR